MFQRRVGICYWRSLYRIDQLISDSLADFIQKAYSQYLLPVWNGDEPLSGSDTIKPFPRLFRPCSDANRKHF